MKGKIILVVFILTLSCLKVKDKSYVAQIEKDLGIKIKKFTVLQEKHNEAIGDYYETFELKVDSTEFQEILGEIKMQQIENSKWKTKPFGFSYELYNSESNEVKLYQISVSRNSIEYQFAED